VPQWLLVILLLVGVHCGASYLVPLQPPDQGLFGGLLRWVWPWGVGDKRFLGHIYGSTMPMIRFALTMGTTTAFALATLGVLGWGVPQGWWKSLTFAGSALTLLAAAVFLGATKLLPIALSLLLLLVVSERLPLAR
jgi:hypothetical protein